MNIYEFLKTGVLGGLVVGDTEDALYQKFDQEWLGKKLYPDKAYQDVYYYYADGGRVEICIQFGEVAHFNIDADDPTFYMEAQAKQYSLSKVHSFEQLVALLDDLKIGWQFYTRYCLHKQVTIVTEGNVLLTFMYLEAGQSYLAKLHINSDTSYENSAKCTP